ncbi:MAG: nicotinate-nucleotide adenylyltransferase NadD [Rhodobacteraceae bacterium HLUCCA12]|nr:MAG: nicotinate-nucleotide adenylyltransferase NadD [Rhodobacteraceae bacterium HLUCCA12]
MRWRDPFAAPGQVVGLFGGSFDPPHLGHVHLSREAIKRLGLDQLWWLVSPGNPIKPDPPAPLERRMAAARTLVQHPRVRITDIEMRLGTRATADTLTALRQRYPGVRFVWVMGADNLAGLHRWDRWQQIVESVPIAVFARPGQRLAALTSRAARQYADRRLPGTAAPALGHARAPAWIYLDMPMRRESSTALRACRQAACSKAGKSDTA